MKFILFITFISYPAFAMFGPHTGMDPICLIALQAGMSGRPSTQPMDLEHEISVVETQMEELEEGIEELREELINFFNNSDCKKEGHNTGDKCPTLPDGSTNKIRKGGIIKDIVSHIEDNKSAPEKCAEVASDGVAFYFENFLPHIQYSLNLPLTLVSPTVAFAQQTIGAGLQAPGTSTGLVRCAVDSECNDSEKCENRKCVDRCQKGSTLPKWDGSKCVCIDKSCGSGKKCNNAGECKEESGRTPASVKCGDCQNKSGYISTMGGPAGPTQQCVLNKTGAACPGGWEERGTLCSKICTENLKVPPGPACSVDSDCGSEKKCDKGDCVDRCQKGSTLPKWDGSKCVCTDKSCGSGKKCNKKRGKCETPPPVVAPTPFDWCENCDCRYKRYFGDKGKIDMDGLCGDPLLLPADASGNVERKLRKRCKKRLGWLEEDIKELVKLEEELEELRDKKEEREDRAEEIRRSCSRNPNLEICRQEAPGATEARAFCTSCFQEVIDAAYPKKSGWDRLLDAVVPLAGTGLAYYGIKETNKLRSRQGFPVDNSAMYGLAYPFIAQMLYGGALGGRGRNALACSPSAHANAYSGIFNAYGQFGMIPGAVPGISGGFFPGGIPVPGYGGGVFNVGGIGGFPGGFFPGGGIGGSIYAGMGIPGGIGGVYGGGIPGGIGGGIYGGGIPGGIGGGIYGGGIPGGGIGGGIYGGGIPGGIGGGGIYGGGIPGYGGGMFGNSYHAQLQMQQQMQSYYMQLQQFQMEKARARQSILMRYQQEAQSLAIKYRTLFNNMSQTGYNNPYASYPTTTGGSPYPPPSGGTTTGGGYTSPYQ